MDAEVAWNALTILAGYFPDRGDAMRINFLDAMESEFRESGLETPTWIDQLRARVG